MRKGPQHGAQWNDEDDRRLRQMAASGTLLPAMAVALGRSQEAVRTRANILGVPVRSSHRGATTRLIQAACKADPEDAPERGGSSVHDSSGVSFERLIREHDALESKALLLLHLVGGPPQAVTASDLLSDFGRDIEEHRASEQRCVYRPLLEAGQTRDFGVEVDFPALLAQTTRDWASYLHTWRVERIEADWDGFSRETRIILRRALQRLELENEVIYPLALSRGFIPLRDRRSRENPADTAAALQTILANLRRCLEQLDRLGVLEGTAELDLAIQRLKSAPAVRTDHEMDRPGMRQAVAARPDGAPDR